MNYKIQVDGVEIDGHPVTVFANNLRSASILFNDYVKKYPYELVTVIESKNILLMQSNPKDKPLARCPNGHSGTVLNEKAAVYRGTNGKTFCGVCGWRES